MKKITIALIVGFIIGTPAGFALSKIFSDVPTNKWYSSAISSLADKGIVNGYSDGTFRPGNYVNRAELAVMLDRLISYLENKNRESSVNSIKITQTIPSENDGFSLGNDTGGDPLSIDGNILSIKVGYGGGCADHDFDLLWDGMFLESDPIQINLNLIHDNNEDWCEAYFNRTLKFDLKPIKKFSKEAYQSSRGKVIINVKGSGDKKKSITYEF